MQSVAVDAPDRLIGTIAAVRITAAGPNSLTGEVVTDDQVTSQPIYEERVSA